MPVFTTPTVGMKGALTVQPPFDTKIFERAVYTCIAVETLQGMVASEQDPLTDIYQAAGLTEAQFDQDVADGVKVLSFQSYDGELLKIPNRYVLAMPDPSGVPYSLTMLGIALSAIPETLDLGPLKDDIHQLVLRRIGVESDVKEITYGPVTLVLQADHDVLNTVRQNNMMNQKSYLRQIETLQAQLSALQLQHAALEQYVATHVLANA